MRKDKFVTKRTKQKRRRLITWSCVIAVLAGLLIWMFYGGIVVKRYEMRSDKVPSGNSVRIVVIADLHSIFYGEGQQILIEKIKAQKPDVIALTGDIVDDNRSEDGAVAFLEGIRGLAPTFYVIGNHEVWSGESERIKEMVAGYGVTVLTNESVNITINGVDLCIGGIDDPEILHYSSDESIKSMDSGDDLLSGFISLNHSTYNVLLAHRPERFASYQKYGFDLVLSGHAHGGQIRIPGLLNGVIAPNQGLFPKYAGGEYTENNQTMIVSRGFGLDARIPRLFNPPEVVVVDITGEN